MKKLLLLFALVTLTTGLVACGDNTNPDPDPDPDPTVDCVAQPNHPDCVTTVDCTVQPNHPDCVEEVDCTVTPDHEDCQEEVDCTVTPDHPDCEEEVDCEVTPDHEDCEVEVDTNGAVFSGTDDITITIQDPFDPMSGVAAIDEKDGDLTSDITISGTVDNNVLGIYDITYSVTDSDGNTTIEQRTIVVKSMEGCTVHQELIDGICVDKDPVVITIMHGAVYEIDPFHEDYSGTQQLERQNRQQQVEELYNVIINYENYSPSASWGPNRVSAIIQSSVSGDHLADIYWVTSDWIQQLVAGDAIVPVTQYMSEHGNNISDVYYDVGGYQGQIYGFESFEVTIGGGLYYNADLIDALGVPNPSQLYLDGDWTWSEFETWATNVQTQLSSIGEDYFALGGMQSYYAQAMIPLNGGSLINADSGRVSFAQTPALETYDFLTTLWDKGLFEPTPQYDAGSPAWQAGKVALHPGSLWFINASNRWGGIPFEIGFVPYPVADDFTGEYVSPVNGIALMTLASGMDPEKEELVFQVWNALQLWQTDAEAEEQFELSLLTKFDDMLYVNSYMDVYDKVYLDLINAIGISAYGENGWTRNINTAIRNGDSRTVVDSIRPIYETALEDYLGN
jgi:maltose-binding protein MalE